MKIAKKIVIDLGTVNSIYSILESATFYCEPSVVVVSIPDEKVVAVGELAKKMLGRTPENIEARKPLKDGVIASFKVTQIMLRHFINKALGKLRFFKPDLMISVPTGLSSIEKEAVTDAALGAGAHKVYLFPEALAAALGADIPIGEPSGSLIINIGGGTTEVALISLGGIVHSQTFKIAGNKFDKAIISYIKERHGLIVGEQTAEKAKRLSKRDVEIKGRSSKIKAPATILLKEGEVFEAVRPVFEELAKSVAGLIEKIPPELSSDILDKGAVLSGGSALFEGLDMYLADYLGLPIHKADDPQNCVARGLKIAFSNLDLFSKNLAT